MENLIKEYNKINKQQWIKSVRKGPTGVGATLENELGIIENREPNPDYNGFEIKSKRKKSDYYTTLFNLTPKGNDELVIRKIRDLYGYYDRSNKYKVLNTNVYGNRVTASNGIYRFKLFVNYNLKIISLYIYCNNILIDSNYYWDFDDIKNTLYRKCYKICFIEAETKIIHSEEYFKYNHLEIYILKSFEKFLELIDTGVVRIAFKIGVFKTGERMGDIHDHGTGFEINKNDFEALYTKIYDSEY